jgi:hypothetical protein
MRVSSNSRSAAFHAQNLGAAGQRCVPNRYCEDYDQDPGRDGDIHDLFGRQSWGYY